MRLKSLEQNAKLPQLQQQLNQLEAQIQQSRQYAQQLCKVCYKRHGNYGCGGVRAKWMIGVSECC
jgi:hypothetical protein